MLGSSLDRRNRYEFFEQDGFRDLSREQRMRICALTQDVVRNELLLIVHDVVVPQLKLALQGFFGSPNSKDWWKFKQDMFLEVQAELARVTDGLFRLREINFYRRGFDRLVMKCDIHPIGRLEQVYSSSTKIP